MFVRQVPETSRSAGRAGKVAGAGSGERTGAGAGAGALTLPFEAAPPPVKTPLAISIMRRVASAALRIVSGSTSPPSFENSLPIDQTINTKIAATVPPPIISHLRSADGFSTGDGAGAGGGFSRFFIPGICASRSTR